MWRAPGTLSPWQDLGHKPLASGAVGTLVWTCLHVFSLALSLTAPGRQRNICHGLPLPCLPSRAGMAARGSGGWTDLQIRQPVWTRSLRWLTSAAGQPTGHWERKDQASLTDIILNPYSQAGLEFIFFFKFQEKKLDRINVM